MESFFKTDKGHLPINEDAGVALPERGLFIVCDGLGRTGGGEIASRIAIESISLALEQYGTEIEQARNSQEKSDRLKLHEALQFAYQEASKNILQASTKDPKHHGICTTADTVLLLGSHAIIAHVGSGRIYLCRHGELHLLTEDHTHLGHYRRAGKLGTIPPEQYPALAKKLTRAVGFQDHVKVDILEVELEQGDRIFLFTDGAWMPAENVLEQEVKEKSLEQISGWLDAFVKNSGEKDNFTFLGIEPSVRVAAAIGTAEAKIKMLGKVPAFAYLSYQDLIKVINVGDLFKVTAGKTICKEGDIGGEMMLILSGSVDITKNQKLIRTLYHGDVFGELSMIDAAPRSASIVARESTNLLAFPREALFSLFRERPDLAVKFLWGVTMETNKRLRMASNKLVGRPEQEGVEVKIQGPLPFEWRR